MISRVASLLYLRPFDFRHYATEQRRFKSNRPEHRRLRTYLEKNKEKKCIICQRNLPHYTLECAHIKPRIFCSYQEKYDYNVVNWMCRNCHVIFDRGGIGVDDGKILISEDLEQFDDFLTNFKIDEYFMSEDYFKYHFNNIFNNN